MNELCQIIKNMVVPNFINMETAIKTYDRNADCCGAPAVYTAKIPEALPQMPQAGADHHQWLHNVFLLY